MTLTNVKYLWISLNNLQCMKTSRGFIYRTFSCLKSTNDKVFTVRVEETIRHELKTKGATHRFFFFLNQKFLASISNKWPKTGDNKWDLYKAAGTFTKTLELARVIQMLPNCLNLFNLIFHLLSEVRVTPHPIIHQYTFPVFMVRVCESLTLHLSSRSWSKQSSKKC